MNHPVRFSIVVPAYNRERLIGRAIASCLRQRHPSFEVVVVDDGSADGTAATVRAFEDPRVHLYVQPVNRGVSAARNLAIARSRGEWIICLDSDDELTDDALETIDREMQASADDRVAAFRFMCRLDDGSVCPVPALRRETWDYHAYLRWAEQASVGGQQETLTCIRRDTYDVVTYPEGGGEAEYHLNFAVRFRTAASPEVVRLYHSDAPDQISRPDVDRALRQAPHHARSFGRLLEHHGEALARSAPGLLALYTRALATHQFLSGDRAGGVATLARLVRTRRVSLVACVILAFGILGPRPLAHAQAQRQRVLAFSH
jgi:glycosyltransferase involved in cell wall biosynthesis